ncbi:hypothetical protein ACFL01_03020 [Planctomycetota bacterium]
MNDDRIAKRIRHTAFRVTLGAVLFLTGMWTVPHRWCARGAGEWYQGDVELHEKFSREIDRWITSDMSMRDFDTGSELFDGEWLFGTYQMAGLGLGQAALEHPALAERHVELMELCIERILTPAVRKFDSRMWRNDPIETLDSDSAHHAAYLGYFNLLLSMCRLLDGSTKYADLNDRITETLVRRLEASPILLLQTYPMQVFPVDNCAVIGSIGLYDRATGSDHSELIARWIARCRKEYVDAESGLLYQCVEWDGGVPIDKPRGSGTTFGSYFLSFADMKLSRELYDAASKSLAERFLGFGVVREYRRGTPGGYGDIDSGPLILGYSISATGFCLAASRIHEDPGHFSRLFSTSYLFGVPIERGGTWSYVVGGPLGNALMYAMLTAPRGGVPERVGI